MSIRFQQAPVDTIIAPSRLVSGFAMRTGYDMGLAATATAITFQCPGFELDDGEFEAVACAFNTVSEASEAYRWRQPKTVLTVADLFQEQRTRLKKLRAAVAKGDRDLPALTNCRLVLMATTVDKDYSTFPKEIWPEYAFSAVVSVERSR